MRRPASLFLIVASLLLGACGEDPPTLVAEPASHDFGPVMQGETREKVFRLTNHGERTLAFRAQPNCACFAVAQSLRPLDPGASLEFRVLFDTRATSPGPVRGKWVTIHTDDPSVDVLVVPLEGEVVKAYDVTPTEFRWGLIDGRRANYEPRTIRVRPDSGYTVALDKAVANPPVVDFRVEEADRGFDVQVILKKDIQRPRGPLRVQVRLDLLLTPPKGEALRQSPKIRFDGIWALDP